MKNTQGWTRALALTTIVGLVGCASGMPTSTAPQQQAGQRQVLSLEDQANFKQVMAALPQRLSAEQAKTLLVQIDPAKVVGSGSYGLQDVNDNRDRWRSQSTPTPMPSDHHRDRSRSYSYYRYGNYNVPYYSYGSSYYPYTYAVGSQYYSPYYYNYGSTYYPYTYASTYTYPSVYSYNYPYSYYGYTGAYGAYGLGQSTVTIQGFSFLPASVNLPVGGTVTWIFTGDIPHTVTSDTGLFDSGTKTRGENFTFTFNTPGIYSYHCAIHPAMRGVVIVR